MFTPCKMQRKFPALLLCVALLSVCIPISAMELHIDDHGAYSVSVGGDVWLRSGDTRFHNKGAWVSTEGITPKIARSNGSDPLGNFLSTSFTWTTSAGFSFETNFRAYGDDLIVFEQVWPRGGQDTKVGDSSSVLSAFPSFKQTSNESSAVSLKSIGWHGTFIDARYRGGGVQAWGDYYIDSIHMYACIDLCMYACMCVCVRVYIRVVACARHPLPLPSHSPP